MYEIINTCHARLEISLNFKLNNIYSQIYVLYRKCVNTFHVFSFYKNLDLVEGKTWKLILYYLHKINIFFSSAYSG